MKDYSPEGFTFFTNYGSRKAQELKENPNAAIAIYWTPLRRQIRIEGTIKKVTREESEKYFKERPRDSQISALTSPQSQIVPSRNFLEKRENEIRTELGENNQVPMPDWGGYILVPHTIEFWQGQSNRLHDRIRFRRNIDKEIDNEFVHRGEDGWAYDRLAP